MDFVRDFINSTFENIQPKFNRVLDNENKNELKIITFKKNNNNLNSSCPITMREFTDGDKITILPCNHLFDTKPIEKWLCDNQAKCPVCRYEFKNTKEKYIPVCSEYVNTHDTSNNISELQSSWDNWRVQNIRQYSQNNIRESQNHSRDRLFSQIFRNLLAFNSINELEDNTPDEVLDDTPDEVLDDTPDDVSDDNHSDPIYDNINHYVSMINNIINRQIYQEENNIIQEAILASIQDQ